MNNIVTVIIFLLSLTSISQNLSVPEIQTEVEKINSDLELVHHSFETNEIYNQTTDGGGTFEVWVKNKEIRKITQSIFLSNGLFITTIYLKNSQPILISEAEKHYQWKDDNSGFDYEKDLKLNYSEKIYSYNWEQDPIEVITEGESLRNETICGISDYRGLVKTARKTLP